MTQHTWDKFNPELNKMESVTVIETVCPCCRKPIRFVDPNHLGLCSYEQEMEHYKNECERLYKEIYILRQTLNKIIIHEGTIH